MKTAIYIEDGVVQLVLTPEGEYEQQIIKAFGDRLKEVKVFNGTFYDCRGGWVRQSAYRPPNGLYAHSYDRSSDDTSLILRVSEAPPMPEIVQ
jgi:hypothetical protein